MMTMFAEEGLDLRFAFLGPDEDFNLDRVRLKVPGPIPEDEARFIWDWMASWGVLHGEFDVTTRINRAVEREAHELTATALAGRPG